MLNHALSAMYTFLLIAVESHWSPYLHFRWHLVTMTIDADLGEALAISMVVFMATRPVYHCMWATLFGS